MSWSYILNIVAVIVAPIIAVWVGQKLQDRQDKRKDKLDVQSTYDFTSGLDSRKCSGDEYP